jgi:hypothetical protein
MERPARPKPDLVKAIMRALCTVRIGGGDKGKDPVADLRGQGDQGCAAHHAFGRDDRVEHALQVGSPRRAPRLAGVGPLYPRGASLALRRTQVRSALRSPSSRR